MQSMEKNSFHHGLSLFSLSVGQCLWNSLI